MTAKEVKKQKQIKQEERKKFYETMDWVEIAFGILVTTIGAIYLFSYLFH